ncbi:hypothetical protein Tco_0534384 [Tanacetum coccineum]
MLDLNPKLHDFFQRGVDQDRTFVPDSVSYGTISAERVVKRDQNRKGGSGESRVAPIKEEEKAIQVVATTETEDQGCDIISLVVDEKWESFLGYRNDNEHGAEVAVNYGIQRINNECICGYEKRNTMEWLPMCEKLEKADGERNWLDMMIVYGRQFADEHQDFALRVNRLIGDMRVACKDRVAFVQGALECGGEISIDLRLTREINALCDRLTAVVDEREAFVDELDMLAGKEFELRAQEKELFIEKLKAICSFSFAYWIWSSTSCTAAAGVVANVLAISAVDIREFTFVCLLYNAACAFICAGEKKVKGAIPEESLMKFIIYTMCLVPLYLETRHELTAIIIGEYLLQVFNLYFSSLALCSVGISKRDKIANCSDATYTSLLQELSRVADSYDIRDQLSVLFQREVVEDSQRMHDYRRLSDELTDGVKMRDEYMNELRMLVNCEEILERVLK